MGLDFFLKVSLQSDTSHMADGSVTAATFCSRNTELNWAQKTTLCQRP